MNWAVETVKCKTSVFFAVAAKRAWRRIYDKMSVLNWFMALHETFLDQINWWFWCKLWQLHSLDQILALQNIFVTKHQLHSLHKRKAAFLMATNLAKSAPNRVQLLDPNKGNRNAFYCILLSQGFLPNNIWASGLHKVNLKRKKTTAFFTTLLRICSTWKKGWR